MDLSQKNVYVNRIHTTVVDPPYDSVQASSTIAGRSAFVSLNISRTTVVGAQRNDHKSANKKCEKKFVKRVQIQNCPLESVYDLREDSDLDLYNDSFAFRRPRSLSSDLLILRKTSRPLSVDVIGLVDNHGNPYKQYLTAVDCYSLAPHTGSIILVDTNVKLMKALEILLEWDKSALLIWSEIGQYVIAMLTLHDILVYMISEKYTESSKTSDAILQNSLIKLNASCKLLEACEKFCLSRIDHIAITQPSGDMLYLLDSKRMLKTVHKQNRSLHFVQWLDYHVGASRIGTWNNIQHTRHDEKVAVAMKKMVDHGISTLPIADEEGRVVDTISFLDIAHSLNHLSATLVQDYLENQTIAKTLPNRPPTSFPNENSSLRSVLDLMLTDNCNRCVFVTDSSNHLIAAISLSDFIRYILNNGETN